VTATVIRSAGNAIVYQQSALFDELGRLMRAIGAAGQQTVFGYDRTDNLKTVTDPRSNLYAYAYDALSRLIRETDQEGGQVNYGLNAQDKVTSYTDPRAIVTSYVRNGFGEAIQETSPDSGVTVYVRNALGDVTQMTDARGVVTIYAYDNAGRMLTKTYPAAPEENIAYSYDSTASGNKGIGRLTSVAYQAGSMSWVYDALGRTVLEARVIHTKTYVTAYAYNAAGNITQITYPSGRIVTYARNALGQVSGITTRKTAASPAETVTTAIAWQPMSDLVSGFTYGNGLTFLATRDLDYRLDILRVQNADSNVIHRNHNYGDGMNLTGGDRRGAAV
jgi:YD repeat-containing protein